MSEQKAAPREFWINATTTEHVDVSFIYQQKPSNNNDVFIHLIEHSAFLELELKLAKAVAAMKAALKDYDDSKYGHMAGTLAIALKDLGESEVGEG